MNTLYLIISLTGMAISYMSIRETVSITIDFFVIKKGNPEDLNLSECNCADPNCEMKGLSKDELNEQKYELHSKAVEDLSYAVFNNICFTFFYSATTLVATFNYLDNAF